MINSENENNKIRLQKFLALRGLGSRREIEEMIKDGLIKVNGELAKLGIKVDESDKIKVKGRVFNSNNMQEKVYIMFNKPKGVLSTCKKSKEEGQTVLDYVKVKERIYPIGRLDKDSLGLLLLTNDGDLALKLTHPRYEHEKEYLIKIQDTRNNNQKNFQPTADNLRGDKSQILNSKLLSDNILSKLRDGVDIGGYITRKSTAIALTKNSFLITLREGKNRQIRRMCEKVGLKVIELKRVRIGKVYLNKLETGKWKYLSKNEIISLNNH